MRRVGLGTFPMRSDSGLTADGHVVVEAPERAGRVLVETARLHPETLAVASRPVIA